MKIQGRRAEFIDEVSEYQPRPADASRTGPSRDPSR